MIYDQYITTTGCVIASVQSISGHRLKIALWNVNQTLFVCKYIFIAGLNFSCFTES